MTVGYRAILTLPSKTDAIALVEQQLHSWLSEKSRNRRSTVRVADWDGPGVHVLGPDATLTVVHADVNGERRRTFRLREENSDGVWLVSVHVFDRDPSVRAGDAVIVELALLGVDDEQALQRSSVPKLVRYLLEVEPATTGRGLTPLTSRPQVVEADEIPALLDSLSDDSRSAAVILAATPDRASQERWSAIVASLTRESVGIATVYVLNENAIEAFNLRVLSSHQVSPGHVRTFLPGADLNDPEDGRRHPFLTPSRLLRSISGSRVAEPLQRVHALQLRRRALQTPLPRDVRRALDLLGREEQKLLRGVEVERRLRMAATLDERVAVAPAEAHAETAHAGLATARQEVGELEPAVRVSSSWPRRLVALVRTWLPRSAEEDSENDNTLDELHRFIDLQVSEKLVAFEQLDGAAALEQRRAEHISTLNQRVDELELELAAQEEEARAHARAARIYEERLRRDNRFADLYIEPESADWSAPDSVATLVDRLTPGTGIASVLDRVVFTGDRDDALEVDSRDTLNRYAPSLWEFVRVLHDYALLKSMGRFSGNVHMYLTSQVDGAKCTPARHASNESESVLTNRAMRAERIRPVPLAVDPSGSVLMASHFKPTHSDTFAPRMHYYDDVDGTGKVYIGYIGRHLSNTRTN